MQNISDNMNSTHTFDQDASERRIAAYVSFLQDAYGVDGSGLAELAGLPDGAVDELLAADYDGKDVSTIAALAKLTGISASWLFAETGGYNGGGESADDAARTNLLRYAVGRNMRVAGNLGNTLTLCADGASSDEGANACVGAMRLAAETAFDVANDLFQAINMAQR